MKKDFHFDGSVKFMRSAVVPPIQQVPLSEMQHGLARPVAKLRLEPAELTRQRSISFQTVRDDLDELEGAVILSESGHQFGLVRHRHEPLPGTDLLINERLADIKAALVEALAALRLDSDELVWVHPDIDLTRD